VSEWADIAERRWAGRSLPRLEDRTMLTGALRYVTDLRPPGTLEIAFVRSPLPRGRIARLDVEAARALPGVVAVLTAADLSHVRPTIDIAPMEGVRKTPRPALAGDVVRFVGEPVAAVLAENRYLAEDGVDLVELEIEPLDPATPLHDGLPDDHHYVEIREFGELDEAFAGAAHRVRRRMRFQRVVTSAIETQGIVAETDPATDELSLHVSTQMLHLSRAGFAEALGLPLNRVRVTCPAMGGAFGGKEVVLPEFLCAAAAALRLGRPVRWVEDRSEALTAGAHGKEADTELEAALDADGTLRGMRLRMRSHTGAYCSGIGSFVEFMVGANSVPGLYEMSGYGYDTGGVVSPRAPLSPFRGVGMTTSQTLREVLLDQAARASGIDRMQLRRMNMVPDGECTTVLGERYEPGSRREAFERSLRLIDYQGFLDRQAAAREQGRLLGLGVSPFVEAAAIGSAGGAGGMPGSSHDSATVTVDLSGTITVGLPTFSHGQGHHTVAAQIVADHFGLSPEDIRVVDNDTSRTPFGMGTFGSRSGVYLAGTVTRAARIVRQKLLTAAGALMEAAPEDIELADGLVGVRGAPASRMPFAALAGATHFAAPVRAVLPDPTLSASAFFDPPAPTHSNGSIAATVEVDPGTGGVRIERLLIVEDCGTMINPLIVAGQIRGGIVQGVGLATLERYVYDEEDQPQTTTLAEYLLPRASDLPEIEIEHIETPPPDGPGGMKGMAEGPASAAPAAVICAVLDAIAPHGDQIEELPLRPESILAALRGARTPATS
jgi:aerobic carbon-monoxide dehydrogenase large subunit